MSEFNPKIADYCPEEMPNWTRLPEWVVPEPNSNCEKSYVFLNDAGLQVTVSIRPLNDCIKVFHVSISQLNSLRQDITPEQLHEYALSQHAEILDSFFPGMNFVLMPDEIDKPYNHHYFYQL